MDYTEQIELLEQYLTRINQARQLLRDTEDSLMEIESQVSALDRTLPDADRLHGKERKQVLKLYDLTSEIFQMIDETIGPPQDAVTGAPAGTTYMPEARGNGIEFSIDDMLLFAKKTHTS